MFVAKGDESKTPATKGTAKKPIPNADPKSKAQPAKPKVEIDKNRMMDPEDTDPGKGYGFEEAAPDSVARCPQCAYELESAEAIVCLTCGYNLLTRTRLHMKKTYETNFMDWVYWLTPSIAATIGCFLSVSFGIFLWTYLKWWWGDWWFSHFSIQIWFTVFAIGGAWYSGKFAFERLVYEFHPPEKVKKQ